MTQKKFFACRHFCNLHKDRQTRITVYGYIAVEEFGSLARQMGVLLSPSLKAKNFK
jgi:hypothetical protein